MRRFIRNDVANKMIAACLVLAVWQVLAALYPPLIIPPIPVVARKLVSIATSSDHWHTIALTLGRLAAGLALGIGAGGLIGIALGCWHSLYRIGKPIIGLVQAVPPVSWLVLAFIWFGFDGRPSMFIVAVSILPIIAVNLIEGIRSIDNRLLQVAQVYKFSQTKRMNLVILPSIAPYFRSAFRISLGTGCKAVVMGEVLTTGNGIGGAITAGRMNIEPESVIAWTLVIVVLYYLLEKIASRFLMDRRKRQC